MNGTIQSNLLRIFTLLVAVAVLLACFANEDREGRTNLGTPGQQPPPPGTSSGTTSSGVPGVPDYTGPNPFTYNGTTYFIEINIVNGTHRYFRVVSRGGMVTWLDAEAVATYMGGYLVTITDQAEQTFIESNVVLFGAWTEAIGYTDQASEGSWAWVTGESSTYSNWAMGEPSNSGGSENVGEMFEMSRPTGDNGEWNDASETDARYYRFLVEME